jgi:hypothetical protein
MLPIFASKDVAGIYFGAKGLVLVQLKAGRIATQSYIPYPQVEGEGARGEDIFEVFKFNQVELVAFLQKALRENRIESRQVVVALPSKDMIVRFFEMPAIPRSEIAAGINFEMKKYIPFKAEELAFDFQYRSRPKANIIEVILCGMRQESLARYFSLFKQLDLNIVAFEPGLFSFYRSLVVANKVSLSKSCVILGFDNDEADIMIIDKGFPYFTRDIKLSAGGGRTVPADAEGVMLRFVNEVRVSLDYFRRQFMKKDVDEMLIVGREEFAGYAEHFHKELGLVTRFCSIQELSKSREGDVVSFDLVKGSGAAWRSVKGSLITLNLARQEKEKVAKAAQSVLSGLAGQNVEKMLLDFLEDSKEALIKGAVLGGIVIALGYGLGFSQVFPLEKEYSAASVRQLPLIPGIDVASFESIQTSEANLLAKRRVLTELIEKYPSFYAKMGRLPVLVPEGVWIERLELSADKKSLSLSCGAYDPEPRRRLELMNSFLARLRTDSILSREFSSIELLSYRESSDGAWTTLEFQVMCAEKGSEAAVRSSMSGGF